MRTPEDNAALIALGRVLEAHGYRFTTVSPATHARVNARPNPRAGSALQALFGWSRAVPADSLPADVLDAAHAAGVLERSSGSAWRSRLRASTLADRLFFHSAYPTQEADAVFFGPDTYRFATAIEAHLAAGAAVRRAVDIGCGAGPGAVVVALDRPDAEVFAVDINDAALRLTAVNAALGGADRVRAVRSDLLAAVDGDFDLIVANPPYLLDPAERTYRHGRGGLGEGLSLAIADLATRRLAPGGTLLLYTGSAIVAGVDAFRDAVLPRLAAAGLDARYRELDPDVFGEELLEPAYAEAERIAAVLVTATRG